MVEVDLMENVGGVVCPVDPAELVMCDSCQ